ncbi:MAG: hypothetical protein WD069_11610 [Planctomycetales bacterium]
MAVNIFRGESDEGIDRLVDAFEKYGRDHPSAEVDLYRYGPVSVHVRIVDPEFARHDLAERSRIVWKYLDEVPEDDVGDISQFIMLTPEEREKSFANMIFEDPTPSELSPRVPNTPSR